MQDNSTKCTTSQPKSLIESKGMLDFDMMSADPIPSFMKAVSSISNDPY